MLMTQELPFIMLYNEHHNGFTTLQRKTLNRMYEQQFSFCTRSVEERNEKKQVHNQKQNPYVFYCYHNKMIHSKAILRFGKNAEYITTPAVQNSNARRH